MNLTQFALMTYLTTGLGITATEFFRRRALTGDDRPANKREAERVLEFCARVQKATPEVLPGEDGEGNDLWCEADELAMAMRRHLETPEHPHLPTE